MIVEFVGLSGSGKTTVAMKILDRMPELRPGRPSLSPESSYIRALPRAAALRFLPGIWARTLTASREFKSVWAQIPRSRRLALVLWACAYRDRLQRAEVYLYDQGLVQGSIYAIRRRTLEERQAFVKTFFGSIAAGTIPDVVVRFATAPESAAARTKMHSELHRAPDELEATEASVQSHMVFLRTRSSTLAVDVDSDHAVSTVTDDVLAVLGRVRRS